MVPVGYDNFVNPCLIAVILSPESSHAKRVRTEASERGMLVNATSGHKTRSVVVLTSNHVVLAGIQPKSLSNRLDVPI